VIYVAALKLLAMHIIDLNGKKITISNLHEAINQANVLVGYFETDERFKDFEEVQKTYWIDILQKLQELAKLN
jgi:hypothetical protein